MLTYEEARTRVIEEASGRTPGRETVPLEEGLGRILAAPVRSDRDYPPFDRTIRDGFAVRSSALRALPARLRVRGEIKAGDDIAGYSGFAESDCLRIMTGAAVPPCFDAVVMVEHTSPGEAPEEIIVRRAAAPGQHLVARASEAAAGMELLPAGARLGYAELALAGQTGAARVAVTRRPRVAILSTGDEIVPVPSDPGPYQIRNSNSVSIAAQVRLAGGQPVALGNARDEVADLREHISRGLDSEILVLSGGVSMGKYDLVEEVLRELGASFFFDSVAIRPGKPAVFGRWKDTLVFGLPGNPVSTMVTFLLFVVPAIDLLGGTRARPLPLVEARLAENLAEKPGLAHFLPAQLAWPSGVPEVRRVPWQGSGDTVAMARSNCFLLVPADREKIEAGERVSILLRPDVT